MKPRPFFQHHNMHTPNFILKKAVLPAPILPTVKIEESEPTSSLLSNFMELKHVQMYIWLARIACFLNFIPFMVMILPSEQQSFRFSVCLYLSMMPVTSFVLLIFSFIVLNSTKHLIIKVICFVLALVCLIMGNIACVCFLQQEKTFTMAFLLLSLSMSLGSIQLLFLLNKSNVLRVMICTASSVLIIILNILAFQNSATNTIQAKRFYQSSSFPFLLLFFETTRSHISKNC